VAVEASVVAEFSRRHRPNDYYRPSTPALAESAGWSHEVTGVDHDVLVLDPDHGLCPARIAFDGTNVAYQVVAAPWPPEEDDSRLREIIGLVKRDAFTKAVAELKTRAADPATELRKPAKPSEVA
jgi:hypothetical protein